MSSFAPSPTRQVRRLIGALAVVALSATPAAAQIDFEELAAGSDPIRYVPNCLVSGGFTFTAVGLGCEVADAFAVQGFGQEAFYTGSAALFNNLLTPVAITADGNAAFTLTSVNLTPGLGLFSFEPTNVTFTAALSGGGTRTQMFTLAPGTTTPMTVSLDGFTDVLWVQYEVTSPTYDGVQIDNLLLGTSVAVIPEPGTVLLLGTGLAGLAVFARRRRRQ